MSLDASNFPSEGQNFNSENLLPSVDFLLNNIGNVHRKIGGNKPAFVPNFGQGGATEEQIKQAMNSMPGQDNQPDVPKSMKLPQAKMMPGANTEPGKSVSEADIKAFDESVKSNINNDISLISRVKSQKSAVKMYNDENCTNPYCNDKYQNKSNIITFFKDSLGNQYKTIGDKLFVLGWQDADVNIRIISEKNGKVIPSNGKKFQIYGWHLVNKITDNNEIEKVSKIDDIEQKLESIKIDSKTYQDEIIKKSETVESSCKVEKIKKAKNKRLI